MVQVLRLRLRHPVFPRDSVANPLELISPALFPELQARGVAGSSCSGSFLGLFLSLSALRERVDREPIGR